MQTHFTLAQLADPETARSEHILRKCVHCGFCTATCPTFVLLGDERDSPRGRIYFIKAMLEADRAPTSQEVRHVDRCALPARLLRGLLGVLMPRPALFRWMAMLGSLAKPMASLLPSTSRDPG